MEIEKEDLNALEVARKYGENKAGQALGGQVGGALGGQFSGALGGQIGDPLGGQVGGAPGGGTAAGGIDLI